MLHYSTIFPETLGLLKKLMKISELSDFSLAGGTALALQIGHRISYDLDLFADSTIENELILDLLHPIIKVEILQQTKNILILDAEGIKLDFVKYRYPTLSAVNEIEEIRLYSIKDIAAMKLAAIAGRGRKRDFVDLYFLLKEFKLTEIVNFYLQKYSDSSEMMMVRSLSYFDDANNDEDVVLTIPLEWDMIKLEISNQVKAQYL
ncbi:MAG: nucleotidyl transferase AbiEii/AbiGii toxin family protein [Saprospiraceae bacterium]